MKEMLKTMIKGVWQDKRKLAVVAVVCAAVFAAGFGACLAYGSLTAAPAPAPTPTPEPTPFCTVEGHIASGSVRVRVNGGTVEWFDGTRWNAVAAEAELAAEDPLNQAMEAYRAFEQGLIDQWAAEAGAEESSALPALPQAGQQPSVWTGGGGGGNTGGGGGNAGGGGTGDGEDIDWSNDYL